MEKCLDWVRNGEAKNAARRPGPWFNIKMSSYQYRKSRCGDKTVVRSTYLHNGISYTDKMSSLYWIGALTLAFPMDTYLPLDDFTFNQIFYQEMRMVMLYTQYSTVMTPEMGLKNSLTYGRDARSRGSFSSVETPFPMEHYKVAIFITTAHHNLFISWGRWELATLVRHTIITTQSLNADICNTLECMCVPLCT